MNLNSSTNYIKRDLEELKQKPIHGVGICQLNDHDFFKYLANIEIQKGVKKGIIVHLQISLPMDYPFSNPTVDIFEGQICNTITQEMNSSYPSYNNTQTMEIEMLDKDIYYTISTLLILIQELLETPEVEQESPKQSSISTSSLSKLNQMILKSYSINHIVNKKTVTHTYACPFPSIYYSDSSLSANQQPIRQLPTLNPAIIAPLCLKRIECENSKENIKTHPQSIFGYIIEFQYSNDPKKSPQKVKKLNSKIITFNKFQEKRKTQPQIQYVNVYQKYTQRMRQPNYNRRAHQNIYHQTRKEYHSIEGFLPIYLNREHYLNSENIISAFLKQVNPNMRFVQSALDVFPMLIFQLMYTIINGQRIEDVEAFIHVTQLFHQLIKTKPEIQAGINELAKKFLSSDENRKDLQLKYYIMTLAAASSSFKSNATEVMDIIFREYSAQIIREIHQKHPLRIKEFVSASEITKKLEIYYDMAADYRREFIIWIEAMRRFNLSNEYFRCLETESYSKTAEQEAKQFLHSVKATFKSVNTQVGFIAYLGLSEKYPTISAIYEQLKYSVTVSNRQGYSAFTSDLRFQYFGNIKIDYLKQVGLYNDETQEEDDGSYMHSQFPQSYSNISFLRVQN